MKRTRYHVYSALVASSALALSASAETLNSLAEFGNSATSNPTSGAGTARGADFANAATGAYSLTAGGTDFWGASDHGSFIWDNTTSRAAGEDFSVIVRSISVAGDPAEEIAGEWGRTGPMARKTPDAANSANVAHIRKTGGDPGGTNPPDTLIQGRPNDGAGTDRGPGEDGEHRNFEANTANGSVRDTPIWLALHRVDGQWYSTWAPDEGGTPGAWSTSLRRAGTPDMAGEVWVGLAHQSHNITPVVNTGLFDGFQVAEFNGDFGDFPVTGSAQVTFMGSDVFLTASGSELGSGPPLDVNWIARYLSATEIAPVPGSLKADIYVGVNNAGNLADFDAIVAGGPPSGTTNIESIHWAASAYTTTNEAGVNLFAEAVPGSFTGNEDQYGVNLTGEIHIPSDTARDGVEAVLFHDGVDDYCYLEIDGIPLIDNNQWSNLAGTGNNGGTQVTLDTSDVKYDDGEWVSFRMVTWEGGGGDDALLVWDALDRTGSDEVTGGADALTASYAGTGLGDGPQVSFAHDFSDKVPKENFRTVGPATVYEESGVGQPNNQQLMEPLVPGVFAVEVSVNGSIVLTEPVQPTLDTGDFTAADVVTFTFEDAGDGGTSDVDENTIMMTVDDVMVTPDSVVKDGTTTTVVYTFPSAPIPYTPYNFGFMLNTTAETGAVGYDFSTQIRSWPILAELRAGLSDPPNATVGWDLMEFLVVPTLGGDLGANEQGFIDAQTVISMAAAPDAQMDQPFVNHSDPDAPGGRGDWIPDLTILTDVEGVDDNQYVTYARTVVTIGAGEEGQYTFRIRGDDGYGLRVNGGNFVSIAGNANNSLDSRDASVAIFPAYSGDSNAYAVCEFPAAGDYLIEFFGFEGGGGSFQEVSWAPGAFTAIGQTLGWALIGDSSNYDSESTWGAINEAVLPPVPGSDESGWSTYIWYEATVGNLTNTLNFVNAADPGAATATFLPQLNHSDNAGGGGVFDGNEAFPGDPTPGADTNNIAMIARAFIVAPTDGDYTIQVRSDDGFLLRFVDPSDQFFALDGIGSVHPSASNEAFFAAGTGDSNTRVAVNLTAGVHELLYIWWEGGGGAHFEISSTPGVVLNHAAPPYELLSTTPSATNLYVSKPAEPAFRITEVIYDPVADQFTLTWISEEGASYALFYDTDLNDFDIDVDDGIDSGGTMTTYGPFDNPEPGSQRIFLRVQKN